MKNEHFAERLLAERKRLGYSQTKVAGWLYTTQPNYSRIENGEIKPSADRLQEMVNILLIHGFEDLPPVELEEVKDKATIVIRWPWHKWSLYAFLVVAAMMVVDYLVNAPADLARGYNQAYAGEPSPSPIVSIIVDVVLTAGILYGLYRIIKWFLLKIF